MDIQQGPKCPACGSAVEDENQHESLLVYATHRGPTERLLNAVGYKWPMTMHTPAVLIHMKCLEPHLGCLTTEQTVKYQGWKIRQMEQNAGQLRREIERVCAAIQEIDAERYFRFIEEPALDGTKDPNRSG